MSSVINGLFSGRSGVTSHGIAISVIGDNISNANTVGFKAGRAEFEDLVSSGQASNRIVGSGSQIGSVSKIFTQGTLESTGRQLDLAIAGNGFFILDKDGERFYTRAGNFKLDNEGYLINQAGMYVLGYSSSGSGQLERINVNSFNANSEIYTTQVRIMGNLNANEDVLPSGTLTSLNSGTPIAGSSTAGTTTYSDLANNAAYSTVFEVFDSLGQSHTITAFFFRTAVNQYTVQFYVKAEEVTGSPPGDAGEPRRLANFAGTDWDIVLSFNGSGQLTSSSETQLVAYIPWANGSNPSTITINLEDFTQFASPSNISSISQNGKGVGIIGNINITRKGEIYALLTNGQSALIGTIALANFANPEGLNRIGSNLLIQTPDSGEPILGKPNVGTFGSLESGRLELSNVDIADQFVKLIMFQKGYQANSRVISSINQLLNELIQLV
ncbi:MAG: flagellar hook protein FlgE [Deltaproteobacteria bacterium]|nr:flagellar hook protein FlgE [Deltaproteobacteria bacterium]MCX7952518.1 flagellar hook protein FlgE [Deltaproteobacteria bacterium]